MAVWSWEGGERRGGGLGPPAFADRRAETPCMHSAPQEIDCRAAQLCPAPEPGVWKEGRMDHWTEFGCVAGRRPLCDFLRRVRAGGLDLTAGGVAACRALACAPVQLREGGNFLGPLRVKDSSMMHSCPLQVAAGSAAGSNAVLGQLLGPVLFRAERAAESGLQPGAARSHGDRGGTPAGARAATLAPRAPAPRGHPLGRGTPGTCVWEGSGWRGRRGGVSEKGRGRGADGAQASRCGAGHR